MPSSINSFLPEGVPSSSIVMEPRRSGIVPSSKTVTPLDATRSPIRPENALEPLRLKSPSSPCPTASCSKMPGQPGPSTTSMTPAGAGTASRLTKAILNASRALGCQSCGAINPSSGMRPPPPAEPLSRRPLCSTMTDTFTRVMGRTSLTSLPSGRRIVTSCKDAAIEALT